MQRRDALAYVMLPLLLVPFCGVVLAPVLDNGSPPPTTPHFVDFRACQAGGRHLHLSPDSGYCADATHATHARTLVIAARDGRRQPFGWQKWTNFRGWTADSHFALFTYADQYGNGGSMYFDTQAWVAGGLPSDGYCLFNMSGDCQHHVAAIAPGTARVLMRRGDLIQLPATVATNVLAGDDSTYIAAALGSPDERYLAYWAAPTHNSVGEVVALIIAAGDGTETRSISTVTATLPQSWQSDWAWRPNAAVLDVTVGDVRYTIDAATGAIETEAAPDQGAR